MDDHEATKLLLTELRDAAREIAQEARGIRTHFDEQRRIQKRMLRSLFISMLLFVGLFGLFLTLIAIFGKHQ